MLLSNPSFQNWKSRPFLSLISLLGLGACVLDNSSLENHKTIPVQDKPVIFSVNSDYVTGSYSIFGIDSTFSKLDIEPIHSDAVVRYQGGNDIFILNRLGRDNLQVINRQNLKTVMQVPFEAKSNPYDIVLKDSLLYIGFLNSDKITILHQKDGMKAGEIDLSAYADTVDHMPETTQLLFVGNSLYALLGNLDTKHGYSPLQSRLVKIDVATKAVVKSLDLPYGNPASIAYDPISNIMYVSCHGILLTPDFSALVLDGGIVGVNLSTFTVTDTLITEKTLVGGVNAAKYENGRLVMDLTDTAAPPKTMEHILSISLKDAKITELVKLGGYQLGGIDFDTTSNSIFIGDRTNGMRVFDIHTGIEKSKTNLSLSALPISDFVVIR